MNYYKNAIQEAMTSCLVGNRNYNNISDIDHVCGYLALESVKISK